MLVKLKENRAGFRWRLGVDTHSHFVSKSVWHSGNELAEVGKTDIKKGGHRLEVVVRWSSGTKSLLRGHDEELCVTFPDVGQKKEE